MSVHHDHHHDHDHGHGVRTALTWTLVLNVAFLVVEAAVGWWTGSLALLADAAHMVGDVGAIGLAVGMSQLARRPATPDRSYGFARAEVIGAFVNGLSLLVAVVLITRSAIMRLVGDLPHVDAAPVMLIGVLGLAVNLGSAFALSRAGSANLNVRGALLHMLADALGSVGAIIAAFLLARGVMAADSVVSLVIAALVLFGAVSLLRDATRILLQFGPPGVAADTVRQALLAIDGIVDVHDLHIWTTDGSRAVLTAHLVTADDADPDALRREAEHLLGERFDILHTTLQSERQASCDRPGCCLDATEPDTAHIHA